MHAGTQARTHARARTFKQTEVAHPLRYDDVHFVRWQRHLLYLALDDSNDVVKPVCLRNLLGDSTYMSQLNTVDCFSL